MDTVSDRMGMFLNCVFEVVQFSSIGGVAVHFFLYTTLHWLLFAWMLFANYFQIWPNNNLYIVL